MKAVHARIPSLHYMIMLFELAMVGYHSAFGDYKKALVFAQKALLQAKGGNKTEIERNIRDLQNGKDMNN